MILSEQLVWAAVFAREHENAKALKLTSFEDRMLLCVGRACEAVADLREAHKRYMEKKERAPHQILSASELEMLRSMVGK